uniref:Uncharacterized protein n=1 Tax=Timema bartmani TaxID=61472 RepID=A0A7R9F2V5_9NEOP|nr:unnamed protein product [Timema bartmani]
MSHNLLRSVELDRRGRGDRGTVPLIFQENWEPSPSAPLLEPTAPAYPELPPPSYDECYFGSSNIKDQGDTQYTFGSTQYVPRYPTYNM